MSLKKVTMVLDDQTHEKLRLLAVQANKSMSELLREMVAQFQPNSTSKAQYRDKLLQVQDTWDLRQEVAESRSDLEAHAQHLDR
jgi:hypothetical protein